MYRSDRSGLNETMRYKHTNLDCLILQRMLWIVHILKCNAIKLPFVDVGDAIVFSSLRRTDWTLQVVTESNICESENNHIFVFCFYSF